MSTENVLLSRNPLTILEEAKHYVHERGIDTNRIEQGLTDPAYIGIMTYFPEAIGYACAFADFKNIQVANVSDSFLPEEITNMLFIQLFAEERASKNLQQDFEEIFYRTEHMPLFLIIHAENSFSQRREQHLKNPCYDLLQKLIQRENVRTILYGENTKELLNEITSNLLFIPQEDYGLSTSSSSGVTGLMS